MTFFCAADPGTTTNAFAFAVVEQVLSRSGRALWVIRHLQSWQGRPGKPLDVRNVQGPECCRIAWRFGCDSILTDAHEHAAMVNAGMTWMGEDRWKPAISMPLDAGELSVITGDLRTVLHDSTGCRVFFGDEIDDATRDEVGKQLASVTYKGDNGKIKIVWPTEGTGHGDEGRAVARALRAGGAGQNIVLDTKPAPVIRAPRTAAYDGYQESFASGWDNDRRW